jgi:hypothetical protein
VTEGPDCFDTSDCDQSGLSAPVFAYDHGDGACSVTGGYVYRGESLPELRGAYLLGDYCSGQIWAVWPAEEGTWDSAGPIDTGLSISSFGEDSAGELYVISHDGGIYRITSVS